MPDSFLTVPAPAATPLGEKMDAELLSVRAALLRYKERAAALIAGTPGVEGEPRAHFDRTLVEIAPGRTRMRGMVPGETEREKAAREARNAQRAETAAKENTEAIFSTSKIGITSPDTLAQFNEQVDALLAAFGE